MRAVILFFYFFIFCASSMAQGIYLRCEVSGVEIIDTLKKEKLSKRIVSVLIKDSQYDISFDITGMPRGSIFIKGLKKFTAKDGVFSMGTSDADNFGARYHNGNNETLTVQSIEISRLDGFISFEESIQIFRTLSENGFQMSGHCKLSTPKQQF